MIFPPSLVTISGNPSAFISINILSVLLYALLLLRPPDPCILNINTGTPAVNLPLISKLSVLFPDSIVEVSWSIVKHVSENPQPVLKHILLPSSILSANPSPFTSEYIVLLLLLE